MPRRKPAAASTANIRRSIATRAARLMAEDGIADYGMAKRKAAKDLTADQREHLPTNEEVEAELRAYQAIYQEDEQRQRLLELRQAAVCVMEFLRDYRPLLTGPVLDGTAGRYADIDIDVFADSSKDVEIMLLSSGISYETSDIKARNGRPGVERLRLDWQGWPVAVSIHPICDTKRQRRDPHTGRLRERADAQEVAALIER